MNRIPFAPVDGCCRRCGRDAAGLDGEFLCEDCRKHMPHFDRAASAMRYDGDARELVNSFKFRDRLWLRDDLVDWLEGVLRARFLPSRTSSPQTPNDRDSPGHSPRADGI